MTLPAGYRFPDVSHYRTVCDWVQYAGFPVSACKATQGSAGKDSSFPAWLKNMRKRNLFPVPYHFLMRGPSVADQVANFLAQLDDGPCGYMLDVETDGVGGNPAVAQANEWFDRVSEARHVPRSNMLCYMPRWWWKAHGAGDTSLRDTICYNSHFGSSPFIGAYAGWDAVQVIQYSSTAAISGLCAPGTGDMNTTVGLLAGQLQAGLTGTTTTEDDMTPEQMKEIKAHVDGRLVRVMSWLTTGDQNALVAPDDDNVADPWDFADDLDTFTLDEIAKLLEGKRLSLLAADGVNGAAGGPLATVLAKISTGTMDVQTLAQALAGLLNQQQVEELRTMLREELAKLQLGLKP